MIDHTGLLVSDLARSIAFYEKALAPLGFTLVMTFGTNAGFGIGRKPELWLDASRAPKDHIHVALRAKSRAEVKAFYDAAIAAGGKDNGAPGVREHYHADYFGGFVLDPDGHNIEAVCHEAYLG